MTGDNGCDVPANKEYLELLSYSYLLLVRVAVHSRMPQTDTRRAFDAMCILRTERRLLSGPMCYDWFPTRWSTSAQ